MASQGPNFVGTAADDNSVGTLAWSNTGNITAEDASVSSAGSTGAPITHYLKGTNGGFSIPVGATINGIVVEIKKAYSCASGRTVNDSKVRIIKGGAISTTERADAVAWVRNTLTYTTYGTSSDLWGETWTATDINASTFGVALSAALFGGKIPATAMVDAIRITVYYTASTGPTLQASFGNAVLGNFMIR